MAETDRFALGLEYEMTVELTELVPKDPQGKAMVNEKVFLDKTYLSYIDSGPIEVELSNRRTDAAVTRVVRSDFGKPLGALPLGTSLDLDRVYTETGRRHVYTRGRAEDFKLKIKSNSHLGVRISAVSQVGTVVAN